MNNVIKDFQAKASQLVGDLTATSIHLRGHLGESGAFDELIMQQSLTISELEASIKRSMRILPDRTGREVVASEYEALERLADDNGKELCCLLGGNVGIRGGTVVEIKLNNSGIRNLSALADLSNLEKLSLSYNTILNIEALSGLVGLRELDLEGNKSPDFSVLADLINLIDLSLRNTRIEDLSMLAGLKNLKCLNLSQNYIQDVTSLSGLINLNKLDLSGNQISDIASLSPLVNLIDLWVTGNSEIKDMSPFFQLTNLKRLGVLGTAIPDSQIDFINVLNRQEEDLNG